MTGSTYILNIEITEKAVRQMGGLINGAEDIRLIMNRGFFGYTGSMTIHRNDRGKISKIEHHVVDYRSNK